MADDKGYTDNDELKADDEISPRPSRSASGNAKEPTGTDAGAVEGDVDARRVPRPATSK